MRKVVTFDFDKTLTRKDVQEFYKELCSLGVECYVLTYRYDKLHFHLYGGIYEPDKNQDVYDLLDEIGCCRSNVIFTNCKAKSEYLNSCNSVAIHIDDDYRVMADLTHNSKVIPIQVRSSSYKQKVRRLLKL